MEQNTLSLEEVLKEEVNKIPDYVYVSVSLADSDKNKLLENITLKNHKPININKNQLILFASGADEVEYDAGKIIGKYKKICDVASAVKITGYDHPKISPQRKLSYSLQWFKERPSKYRKFSTLTLVGWRPFASYSQNSE